MPSNEFCLPKGTPPKVFRPAADDRLPKEAFFIFFSLIKTNLYSSLDNLSFKCYYTKYSKMYSTTFDEKTKHKVNTNIYKNDKSLHKIVLLLEFFKSAKKKQKKNLKMIYYPI